MRLKFVLCLCALLICVSVACNGPADKKEGNAGIQTAEDKEGMENSVQLPLTEEEKVPIENFTDFIERWNYYLGKADLREIAYHYELIGNKIADTPLLFDTLESWLKVFRQNLVNREKLDRLKEQKLSIIELWDDYRKAHLQDVPFSIADIEDGRELAKRVNDYAGVLHEGVPVDVVTLDTVRAIVAMNDICAFFYINKETIYDMNVDKKIKTCDDLKRSYPEFLKNY